MTKQINWYVIEARSAVKDIHQAYRSCFIHLPRDRKWNKHRSENEPSDDNETEREKSKNPLLRQRHRQTRL